MNIAEDQLREEALRGDVLAAYVTEVQENPPVRKPENLDICPLDCWLYVDVLAGLGNTTKNVHFLQHHGDGRFTLYGREVNQELMALEVEETQDTALYQMLELIIIDQALPKGASLALYFHPTEGLDVEPDSANVPIAYTDQPLVRQRIEPFFNPDIPHERNRTPADPISLLISYDHLYGGRHNVYRLYKPELFMATLGCVWAYKTSDEVIFYAPYGETLVRAEYDYSHGLMEMLHKVLPEAEMVMLRIDSFWPYSADQDD